MFVIPDRRASLMPEEEDKVSRKHPLKVRARTDMPIGAFSVVESNSLERSQQWLKKKNKISVTTRLFNKSTHSRRPLCPGWPSSASESSP
jgi:hypothetical protein